MRKSLRISFVLAALATSMMLVACGGQQTKIKKSDAEKVAKVTAARGGAYIPHNNVEFKNYNAAQKLFDTPSTIIFCTTTWGNASAPLVTVPIAGKLTSSSTSYFSPTKWTDRGNYSWTEVQQPSVDGMYHPNPPQYRYAFTPGGQYVDFFNMPTFCTTALTKFQRQSTKVQVSLDPSARTAQKKAEAALRRGDKAGAQSALEAVLGG